MKKLRLFKEFKFFSLRVLFADIINYFIDFISIKSIDLNGKKIKFYATGEISFTRAKLFGKKEKEVYNFIDQYLKSDDIFFDIGANIGVFSIYASIFKNVNCIAFEPEYSNLYLLKKNIILNSLSNKINVYPLSISDKNNLNFLHLSSLETGSALHSISQNDLELTDEKAKVVMKIGTYSLTIDEFVKQAGIKPNMLKIDTDGNEVEILRGAKETLSSVDYIAMEMPVNLKKKDECLKIMKDNLYEPIENLQNERNLFFKKK